MKNNDLARAVRRTLRENKALTAGLLGVIALASKVQLPGKSALYRDIYRLQQGESA